MHRLTPKEITIAIKIGREIDQLERPLLMKELPVVTSLTDVTLRPAIKKLIHARIFERKDFRSGLEKGEKWQKYFNEWVDLYS